MVEPVPDLACHECYGPLGESVRWVVVKRVFDPAEPELQGRAICDGCGERKDRLYAAFAAHRAKQVVLDRDEHGERRGGDDDAAGLLPAVRGCHDRG